MYACVMLADVMQADAMERGWKKWKEDMQLGQVGWTRLDKVGQVGWTREKWKRCTLSSRVQSPGWTIEKSDNMHSAW